MNSETMQQLRQRIIPRTTDPRNWPTDQIVASPDLSALVRKWREELDNGVGYIVVDTLTSEEHNDVVCSAAWNAFTLLASVIPQYATGELVYDVEVASVGTEGAHGSSHYSRTNSTGGHHTDGTLLPQPPELVLLNCVSSAASGGATIVIDSHLIREAVAAGGDELLSALRKTHPFSAAPGVPGPSRPILIEDEDGFRFNYLRRYIELGYADEGMQVPAALVEAMDRIDTFTSEEENQIPFLLQRGEALVFDNTRFVHGRRSFVDGESGIRLLHRGYGMRR